MNRYTAVIGYDDDKTLNVQISEKEIEALHEAIRWEDIFWNIDRSSGFWTDISKIRYINFIRLQEDQIDDGKEQRDESDSQSTPQEDE